MNWPRGFIASLTELPGFNREAFEAVHAAAISRTSVRLNPAKRLPGKLPFTDTRKIGWAENGYYLTQRPSFITDPLLHAGAYYVQEASSMFVEQAVRQLLPADRPLTVLDLCAAPGGKSTHMASLMPANSVLVSNEIIQSRLPILTENLVKWGHPNVLITQQDAADFGAAGPAFDCVLIDAPCSGSGLFRRDPDAMQEWSEAAVNLCSQRQQRILADAMPSLQAGGILIYSTCSYSIEENEQIVDWLIEQYALETCRLQLAAEWNIVETRSNQKAGYGYRFYPDQAAGEGFFLAAFRLSEPVSSSGTGKRTIKTLHREKPTAQQQEQVSKFIQPVEDAQIVLFGDEWRLLPLPVWNLWNEFRSVWRCRKAGVALGSLAGNDLIPAHDLAVSTLLHPNVSRLELDLETALQYLRKLTWTPDAPHKGWTVVTYQHMPLGWIKALPNRINNYYPSHWRILNK